MRMQARRSICLWDDPDPALVQLLSAESQVTKDTPPTFLFTTTEDKTVPVMNSVMFYSALVKAGVPAELHVFQHGAHGAGLAAANPELSVWLDSGAGSGCGSVYAVAADVSAVGKERMMTMEEFRVAEAGEFEGPLLALLWDGRGNWDKAHEVAQDVGGAEGELWYMRICIGRRVMQGMRLTGIGGRANRWPVGTGARSGNGLRQRYQERRG